MQEGSPGPHPLLQLATHVASPFYVGYCNTPVLSGIKDWSYSVVLAIRY